ncbi:MAG: C4-type zinc ribbon domain-containing protein [Anaerolineaceae bacterium]
MNFTFSLYRLQTLDTQRQKITKRLAQIDAILNADEAVRARLQEKTQAEASLAAAQQNVSRIAGETSEKRLKLELNQVQLFGGKIRNPKELQDLQAESEALRRFIQKLEEAHFEALMTQENAQKALVEAEAAYQSAVNQKAAENSLLAGERGNLLAEMSNLNSQREALTQTLPAEIVAQYESLLKTKAGRAVAAIIDDGCEACGVELSPRDVQAVRSSTTLMRCKTCGRILYKA